MVLVEEGPWENSVSDNLRRIQDRLYGCVDAALDGQLAQQFPETMGKKLIVQLDCYNLPRDKVTEFFEEFSRGIFALPEYRQALSRSPFVRGIGFEINFDSIN